MGFKKSKGKCTFASYFAWSASIDATFFEYTDAEKDAEEPDPQAVWVRYT